MAKLANKLSKAMDNIQNYYPICLIFGTHCPLSWTKVIYWQFPSGLAENSNYREIMFHGLNSYYLPIMFPD